jgi:hypothetical protein
MRRKQVPDLEIPQACLRFFQLPDQFGAVLHALNTLRVGAVARVKEVFTSAVSTGPAATPSAHDQPSIQIDSASLTFRTLAAWVALLLDVWVIAVKELQDGLLDHLELLPALFCRSLLQATLRRRHEVRTVRVGERPGRLYCFCTGGCRRHGRSFANGVQGIEPLRFLLRHAATPPA